MSFRRLPFQFTTTDPVERQRELERRFGLSSSKNMYVDVPNPLTAGAAHKETSSPRLQHRVPIFLEGHDQPIHSSVDSIGSASENKKPNVRVIPIEIEGAENRPATRHRTFSGPAGMPREQNEGSVSERVDAPPLKRSMIDLSSKPSKVNSATGPRVHDIPIQVEGTSNKDKATKCSKETPKVNGCAVSKSLNKVKSDKEQKSELETNKDQKIELKTGVENSLKKVEEVLIEFKTYETGVQQFTGNATDKQYRYLDEMLTRCMLRLDDIDTMGNENVRSARKNAVKKIQASIDLLERKANETEVKASDVQETKTSEENVEGKKEAQKLIAYKIEENDIKILQNQGFQHEAQESNTCITVESEVKSSEMEKTSKTPEESACSKNELQGKIEGNDVEMQENQDKAEDKKQDINTEVILSPHSTVINVSKVEMTENPAEVEKSSKVPEVEMAEIQVTSSKGSSSENEVEMTDHSEHKSDQILENAPETTSVQTSSNVTQDIEMKDVQTTLGDVRESTVTENVKCSSSQSEQDESVMSVEAKTCTNDILEKSMLSSKVSDCSIAVCDSQL